ncbi:CDP-diacylglycerol--serine O-phosphatidyltransferase [Halorutilales archaeon Cl-col2-1]
MAPRPRLVTLLRIPDAVSLANTALGFAAVTFLLSGDTDTAARLVLLAGVADGLDGILARQSGTSQIGVELDSLADAVSFGVVPASLVHVVTRGEYTYLSLLSVVFLLSAVVRLAVYNVKDSDSPGFTGVPSTLAGITVASAYLSDLGAPTVFFVLLTSVLAYLMVIDTSYPDLRERDAVLMGGLIGASGVFPDVAGSALPRLLLVFLVLFVVGGPSLYPNPEKEGH